MHSFNSLQVRERFRAEIARIQQLMPEAEVVPLSAAELAFRCHGLEFARASLAKDAVSLRHETEIVFGVGAGERVSRAMPMPGFLPRSFAASAKSVIAMVLATTCCGACTLTLAGIAGRAITWPRSMSASTGSTHYSQVPAFAASDRAMIDVLAVTRESTPGSD